MYISILSLSKNFNYEITNDVEGIGHIEIEGIWSNFSIFRMGLMVVGGVNVPSQKFLMHPENIVCY